MQQSLVIKLKIKPNPEQAKLLVKTMKQYAKACTWCSEYYFNHGMNFSKTGLHDACYYPMRSKFKMKSAFAASVTRTVTARYKSVNSQMKQTYDSFEDKDTKKWYRVRRNKYWLWHPIHFNRPQVDLCRGRDWSFTSNKLSLLTCNGRIKMDYVLPNYFRKFLKTGFHLGTGKIIKTCGKWYFYIGATRSKLSTYKLKQSQNIVGIDRGLRFIAVSYGKHNHDLFFNGKPIIKKRKHFLKQRAILQSRETESSKRKLKQLSGRENRWMSDVNHRISKTLIQSYQPQTTFVLEDLAGIRWTLENVPKKYRYTQVSWSFYQLGQMLTYKAKLNHDRLIHIDPQYTSQRCPRCGHVLAENRNHYLHYYKCKYCGYTINDDLVGAMNIAYLGKEKSQGVSHPKIKKTITVTPTH